MTASKAFVHLLVFDPNGPIKAQNGVCLRVACNAKSSLPNAASNLAMSRVISCPLCLESADFKELCDDFGGNSADQAAHEYAKSKGI